MSLVQMTLSGGAFILFIVAVRALALYRLPKGAFLACLIPQGTCRWWATIWRRVGQRSRGHRLWEYPLVHLHRLKQPQAQFCPRSGCLERR